MERLLDMDTTTWRKSRFGILASASFPYDTPYFTVLS
jgi:hypothetical protein